MRLMVPVLVATITHCILQVYIERMSHGQFTGSFLSFIPEYFNGLYFGIGVHVGNFAFHGMHLWYLLFLFLDCMICYRLFVWFKGSGERNLNELTALMGKPGVIYIWFFLPLFIMKAVIPEHILNAGAGAWGFLYYLWFLISGFMIVSNDRLRQNIMNQRWISLVLGVALSATFLYQSFSPSRLILPAWISYWAHTSIYFFSTWCWLFAILGFSMRFLNFDRPFLRNANEGVLPFYILHQPVLVITGFFVMSWEIHDLLKWMIVLSFSIMVILSFYISLVRRFDLLRFLFGMKTTHPFLRIFKRKAALILQSALYVGLIALAISGISVDHTPMPATYDPAHDIVLDSKSISDKSQTGIHVVGDDEASTGQAIEFLSGANKKAKMQPQVYVEMHFSAPAGRYNIWLRGKCEENNLSDSIWLQVDDQIGTPTKSIHMGNWLEIHPIGVYAWAGNSDKPIAVELNHTGDHVIRIQPRQTPHRIDQIWLSRLQHRIPDTYQPIKQP